MKIQSLVFLLAATQHLSCDAARASSPKQEDYVTRDVAIYEGKEYVRDESKEIVQVITHTNKDRFEMTCGQNERELDLKIMTDNYGYETSYELKKVGGDLIAWGPEGDKNYADQTAYSFKHCVEVGQRYRLRIKDKLGDGLCCNMGKGTYLFGIDGGTIYNSRKKKTFSSVATHTFKVRAPPSEDNSNASPDDDISKSSGSGGCITINAQADKNADELSWRIVKKDVNQVVGRSSALMAFSPVSKKVCLPPGEYNFEMRDTYGDGMCCGSGKGFFQVLLDGREVARGGHFTFTKSLTIQVNPPFERNMSDRDRQWLDSHNTRRGKYHAEFGKSYVPLKWSPQLAAEANEWAKELLGGCDTKGIKHEPSIEAGENLAKNRGSGSFGNKYSTENILTRWVEKERYLGYPANAHLTQVLWRGSKYVGCGEASKSWRRGNCRVQVCRYLSAGNCNMKHHKASIGNNWKTPMLEDNSRCGPTCAPEGCY